MSKDKYFVWPVKCKGIPKYLSSLWKKANDLSRGHGSVRLTHERLMYILKYKQEG